MIELINVKTVKKKAVLRFYLHIIVISLLTIGVILGSVFSLIYSSLDYNLNVILNLVVDSVFVCFLIFYFFTIFPVVNHYYKLFRRIDQVAYEHRRQLVYLEEKENRIINNVKFRTLVFSYKEGENTYQENLYILDNDFVLKEGTKYSLYTYQNVIIRLEDYGNATV